MPFKPLNLVALALVTAAFFRLPVPPLESDPAQLPGTWIWHNASVFELQKITVTFSADSFYLVQRYIDPGRPKRHIPCAQANFQMYALGKYSATPQGDLTFNGQYADSNFSRDTLRLCRDTGFRPRSRYRISGDSLCLGAGPSASEVCLTRVRDR